MAQQSIFYVFFYRRNRVTLCKNGLSESLCSVTTFWVFFNDKKDSMPMPCPDK